MKHSKLITWLSAGLLGLAAAAFSPGMTAEAAIENGFEYTYNSSGGVTVTGYSGPSNIIIPQKLGGRVVTTIGKEAFKDKYTISSVTFPNTIKTIGEGAFKNCLCLENVTLPASVQNIERSAFSYCTNLTSVSLPNGLRNMGEYAFCSCISLKKITLPNCLSKIERGAFSGCRDLNSIEYSNICTLEYIGKDAFASCESLTSFKTPPHLNEIAEQAFYDCTGLQSVTIGYGVNKVGPLAFYKCSSLQTAAVLGATELGFKAFGFCESLSNVRLSDSSRSERNAFADCINLTRINNISMVTIDWDENGIRYPKLSNDSSRRNAVRNHFTTCLNVGFINNYCQQLCEYIVKTETDPWMNDELKAKLLHDWIVRHCEYEDEENGESVYDYENMVPSSVFLSYAMDVRGEGIGESVCEGYSKAYTMLLAAAGIESYPIYSNTHEWTLVKIGEKYYQVDVTWDDPILKDTSGKTVEKTYETPYSTDYSYFLLSNRDMEIEHEARMPRGQNLNSPKVDLSVTSEHPLLRKYTVAEGNAAIACNCPETYLDANRDGILDYDYDLDGIANNPDPAQTPNLFVCYLFRFAYGMNSTPEQLNGRLPALLAHLHEVKMSPTSYSVGIPGEVYQSDTFRNSKHVIAKRGTKVKIPFNIFGEGLTFQWVVENPSTGQWENAPFASATSSTLELTVNNDTHGKYYKCLVYNQDGILYDFFNYSVRVWATD